MVSSPASSNLNFPASVNLNHHLSDSSSLDSIEDPKFELYEMKGNVLFQRGDFGAAAQSYRQAIQIQPQAQLYLKLARALHRLGQRQDCFEAQYQASLLDPTVASASEIHRIGQALEELEQGFAAMDCYRQAIAKDHDIEEYHLSLGAALTSVGKEAEAETSYRQALTLNPASGDAHLFFGNLCRDRGEMETAARHYLGVLKQQPDNAEAYVWLRYSFLRYQVTEQSEILSEVVEACREILAQAPHWISINSLLGYALTKKGDGQAAIAYYKKASQHKAKILKPQLLEEPYQSTSPTAPSFIILGGFKCATTSLYNYIIDHPQVLPSLEKELDFFDRDYKQGLDWYLAHFPEVISNQSMITGEATPNYLYSQVAPERIHRNFPDVKLIIILRDPIERAFSHYHFLPQNDHAPQMFERVMNRELTRLQTAFDENQNLDKIISNCPYLGNGLYELHLRRWLKYFAPEQLLILPMDGLSERPSDTVKHVYNFLGLPGHELSQYKRHKVGSYPKISAHIQKILTDFFKPHNQNLNKLLGELKFPAVDW